MIKRLYREELIKKLARENKEMKLRLRHYKKIIEKLKKDHELPDYNSLKNKMN